MEKTDDIEEGLRIAARCLSELTTLPRLRIESSPVAVSILRDNLEELQVIHRRVSVEVLQMSSDPLANLIAAHLGDVVSVLKTLLVELDQNISAPSDVTQTVGRLGEELLIISEHLHQIRADQNTSIDRSTASRLELETDTGQPIVRDTVLPKVVSRSSSESDRADNASIGRFDERRILPFAESKRPVLLRRLKNLVEEYEACATQHEIVRDPSDQVRIKRQMDDLEQRIKATERELKELEQS